MPGHSGAMRHSLYPACRPGSHRTERGGGACPKSLCPSAVGRYYIGVETGGGVVNAPALPTLKETVQCSPSENIFFNYF